MLGKHPAKALRIARDTGVLVALLPEFAEAVGFDQESRYHDLTVDEHTFAVVQAAADGGARLRVRLAALFHDLGKPRVAGAGRTGGCTSTASPDTRSTTTKRSAQSSRRRRFRVSGTRHDLRRRVVAIVRAHMFNVGRADPLRARRMLARYGDELTFDLLDHKEADLRGKREEIADAPQGELEKLERFRGVVRRELKSPHRLGDLAIDGRDLIALGYTPGPRIGRALRELLKEVVEDPTRNDKELLLRRAKELNVIRLGSAGLRRRVHHARRRRERRRVRVAEPHDRHGRRPRLRRARIARSPALRSGSTRRGSRSTARCTRRPSTAPGSAESRATACGPTSRDCRCSRCPPTACRSRSRARKARPRSRSLHAGWRGLSEGVVEAGVRALGDGAKAAIVGPAIGPCCYEVGDEVSERFDDDLTRDRKLNLWEAAERALRRAGVERVDRVDRVHARPSRAVLLTPSQRARAWRAGAHRCSRLR